MRQILLSLHLVLSINALAQTGLIRGTVTDAANNQPIPFANIILQGTTIGAS